MKTQYLVLLIFLLSACKSDSVNKIDHQLDSQITEQGASILLKADGLLSQEPTPLTLFRSERSEGGIHDFYSEGDYWWQNPEDPEGPFIRRDGLSNPSNFLQHRIAMRNLNEWVSTLVAAYELSGEEKYADHALRHLHAFFISEDSRMNPNLLYAQAIKGRHSGRGIGIIDTIHLIEVVKAILILKEKKYLNPQQFTGYKDWFNQYATWLNTHKYGLDEKDHGNNHSTWWAAQVASFATIADREDLIEVARSQFKKLLPAQMNDRGQFPEELSRTKPYIYSLFNLEGYAVLCELASKGNDLWNYEGATGSLSMAFDYMIPFIEDKDKWPLEPDVSHFDEIPIQSVGLFLAANAYEEKDYMRVYKLLKPTKKSEEIKRNFPLWYPQNWI